MCPLCAAGEPHRPRFVLRAVEGRWVFRREGAPFRLFDSKAAAVACAQRILSLHPGAELIVEAERPR